MPNNQLLRKITQHILQILKHIWFYTKRYAACCNISKHSQVTVYNKKLSYCKQTAFLLQWQDDRVVK